MQAESLCLPVVLYYLCSDWRRRGNFLHGTSCLSMPPSECVWGVGVVAFGQDGSGQNRQDGGRRRLSFICGLGTWGRRGTTPLPYLSPLTYGSFHAFTPHLCVSLPCIPCHTYTPAHTRQATTLLLTKRNFENTLLFCCPFFLRAMPACLTFSTLPNTVAGISCVRPRPMLAGNHLGM